MYYLVPASNEREKIDTNGFDQFQNNDSEPGDRASDVIQFFLSHWGLNNTSTGWRLGHNFWENANVAKYRARSLTGTCFYCEN